MRRENRLIDPQATTKKEGANSCPILGNIKNYEFNVSINHSTVDNIYTRVHCHDLLYVLLLYLLIGTCIKAICNFLM